MTDLLHFEDMPVGEVLISQTHEVTADEIKAFAAEFDPQPFHLNEADGARSIAGALSASGWHTLAMTQRLMFDAYLHRAASMGSFGVEEVKWLKPVFPGDILTLRCEILDARVSTSRPEMGILTMHWQTFNQNDEVKLDMRGTGLLKVRGTNP